MHRDLATLFKLRLGFFVVLSAVLGWFMATETIDLPTFLTLTVGGYALTGASNGLNQIIERRIDGHMNEHLGPAVCLRWPHDGPPSLGSGAAGRRRRRVGVPGSVPQPPERLVGCGCAIVSYAFIYTPLKGQDQPVRLCRSFFLEPSPP